MRKLADQVVRGAYRKMGWDRWNDGLRAKLRRQMKPRFDAEDREVDERLRQKSAQEVVDLAAKQIGWWADVARLGLRDLDELDAKLLEDLNDVED